MIAADLYALLNRGERLTIIDSKRRARVSMVATGELIRMMNYIDDIATTLRRVQVGITTMSEEEKKRLAEYMRKSDPNFIKILESLEKS